MNVIVARATLEREAKSLRRSADELRPYAPMIAMKIDAAARECEMRRDRLEGAEALTSIETLPINPRRDFDK